ncbi:MAG: hypothetical protein ABW135_17835 [Thermoleophilaceae bacterium]
MKKTRRTLTLGLVALLLISMSACGDDDESNTDGGAVAPPPARAFGDLAIALEGSGLVVTPLPRASLDGAEGGVAITGDKSGSARDFATEAEAHTYADEVAKSGEKTTIVKTVVFQAASEEDADFFADAYE